MTSAFDRELAIERTEAHLAAVLDEHGAAVVAALRTGARPPPWPRAVAAMPALAADHDPLWAARARILLRWRLAAQVASDPDMIAAQGRGADLDGLAARYRALAAIGARRGGDGVALAAALYGVGAAPIVDADDGDPGAAPIAPATPLPRWQAIGDALAARAGVALDRVAVRDDGVGAATVMMTGAVVCVFPPVRDLGGLLVAAHELGHGLYAAAMRGLPLGLAAAPSRWFDEAIAAWAVATVAEAAPAWAATVAWRRARAVAARRRLAAVEATLFAGGDAGAAWAAQLGAWRPSLAAALLAEPGVGAAYAVADAAVVDPAPGAIAAWGAEGAALDVAAAGIAPVAALA